MYAMEEAEEKVKWAKKMAKIRKKTEREEEALIEEMEAERAKEEWTCCKRQEDSFFLVTFLPVLDSRTEQSIKTTAYLCCEDKTHLSFYHVSLKENFQ